MPRPHLSGRRVVLYLLGLLIMLALAAGWIGLRGQTAQRHLEAARVHLETARAAATERRVQDATAAVVAAGLETEQAHALTSDALWRLVGSVPYAGATVQTASGLAEAADQLAREVLPDVLRAVEQADPDALRRPDGAVDLALLKQVTPPIVQGADGVTAVRDDLARLPRHGVVSRVAAARDELVEQISDLADSMTSASTAVRLAPALLGEDRMRRYVVLVQQNAESRGTGGLPGGYAVVEAEAGRLRVVQTGSNADAPDGPISVAEDVPRDFEVRYRARGAFDLWVNSNVSPDLPVVSRVIAHRFAEQRSLTVDGVVALDAQALALILAGSEPVALADGGTVPADQLVEYLAIGQYASFATLPGEDVSARSDERKEALALIGAQTAARLAGGQGSSEALLRGLVDAVRSGHLRMASDDPALAMLHDAGVDGALPSPERPVAYPVVVNATGGKLDHFLDRSVRYVASGCDEDRRSSSVTVTLTNQAPEQGLPPYVTVRQVGDEVVSSSDNEVTLSVYATAGATLRTATLDGVRLDPTDPDVPFLSRSLEGGLPVWTVNVELPRGEARTLQLDLEEPVLPGRVQVPEQPLSRPLGLTVDAPVC